MTAMRFCLPFLAAALLVAGPPPASAQAPENVMLILDASGSMWGQVEGRTKIEIAREVVGDVLQGIKPSVRLGVMTYGHRSTGDCKDIETILPVGPINAQRYMERIDRLNPKGKTPISDAVRRAADELRYRETKATIVLVSDGLETCNADPCALAAELEKQGIDFTVHVVGFDLKKEDTTSLKCLAETTGGRYVAAANAGELADAIGDVVAQVQEPAAMPAAPPPPPPPAATTLQVTVHLAEDSPPLESAYVYVIPADANKDKSKAVDRGASSRPFKAPAGQYDLETKYGAALGTATVTVADGKTNRARIILNAGLASVKATEVAGGPPNDDAYVTIYAAEQAADGSRKTVTAGNQRNLFTIPAGRYYATAQIGKARAGAAFEVVAGKRADLTIVLASGTLKVAAATEEGGKPIDDAYIRVFEVEPQANGERRQVTAGNQRTAFTVPAGRYYVTATVGKAAVASTVEVKAAERTEVTLILAVGALKVTGIPVAGAKPIDSYVEILEPEKQLDGSRKRVTAGNHNTTFKLPAGAYHVVIKAGQAAAAQDVAVAGGKLTEVTVALNAGSLDIKADKSLYVTIYRAEKNLDGSRDRVAGVRPGRPIVLTAGKYYLEGKAKDVLAEAEAEVTAGKLTEVELKP